MEMKWTYQQQDSLQSEKPIDSVPLNLLEIEDESNLFIPKRIQRTIPRPQNHLVQSNFQSENKKDTFNSELNITNMPVRKVQREFSVTKTEEKILFDPIEKPELNKTVPTFLLLGLVFLLSIIKAFNSTRVNQIVKSWFSYYASQELTREEKVFFHRVNIGLFIVFFAVSVLLIDFLFFNHFLQSKIDVSYLKISFILASIYIVKTIGTVLFSTIFSLGNMLKLYFYNVLSYNYLFAVLSLPVLILIYFSPISSSTLIFYFILPFFTITFLMRIVRIFLIGKENNILNFYNILYICTLEILPLVVLSKIFVFK